MDSILNHTASIPKKTMCSASPHIEHGSSIVELNVYSELLTEKECFDKHKETEG